MFASILADCLDTGGDLAAGVLTEELVAARLEATNMMDGGTRAEVKEWLRDTYANTTDVNPRDPDEAVNLRILTFVQGGSATELAFPDLEKERTRLYTLLLLKARKQHIAAGRMDAPDAVDV